MGCGAGAHKKYSNAALGDAPHSGVDHSTSAPSKPSPRPGAILESSGPVLIPHGCAPLPSGTSPRPRRQFADGGTGQSVSAKHTQGRAGVGDIGHHAPAEAPPALTRCQDSAEARRSRGPSQVPEALPRLGGDRPGDVHGSTVQDWERGELGTMASSERMKNRLPSVVPLSAVPAVAVGIDLGSTYSCVAAFNQASDQLEIVTNNHGNRQTPSYVAFTGDERLVGDDALDQVTRNPRNTVFDSKHLTKRSFSDQAVQAFVETLPNQVSQGPGNELLISVSYKGVDKKFKPTQISAMVLAHLKFTTERYLCRPALSAVLTVPFYFKDRQRQAVKDAALVAGFREVTLVNETTAAAIAYVYSNRQHIVERRRDQILLVLHVGRSSCDASLVKVTDRCCHVTAAYSHAPLGGLDFDRRLLEYCKDMFKSKNNGKDISECLRALARLRLQCERTKRLLSSSTQAVVEVDSLFNGLDFSVTISRQLFEDLNKDLLQEVIVPIGKVLHEASIDRRDIDDVLLVGGPVRIPKVQALVREFFNGKELCMTVDPSEAVAFGAAVYACCQACQKGLAPSEGFDATFPGRNFSLKDVMPVSLGIEMPSGKMTTIVPRNARLPRTYENLFTTERDKQECIVVRAFEGEADYAKDNHCLGSLRLDMRETQFAKPGAARIKVRCSIDVDGILSVTAQDMQVGTTQSATMRRGVSSVSEVEQMMQDAELFALEDAENRERIKARNALEESCYNVRAAIAKLRGNAPQQIAFTYKSRLEELEHRVQDILDWLDFGDPLLHVAAQLKQRFPEYSFGYDGQTLAVDAPLRKLETPLKESRRGYREALDSISERDTLQVVSEMDCERSYRGLLLKDSAVRKMKQQAHAKVEADSDDSSPCYDKLTSFEPDALQQEQHIVPELMRVAAAAQEELRHRLAPAENWQAVLGKANQFECTTCVYADLVRDPGIKLEDRVRQKANAKYRHLLDRRFARVRDIARFALTYNTLEGLLAGLQRIRHDFKIVELENRFAKPTALGWRDVTLLVQMQVSRLSTSHIVEIQMSHRSLVQARQQLHKHWKLVRELLPGTCKVAADDMDEVQDTILCELQSSGAVAFKFTTGQFKGKLRELEDLVSSCGSSELARELDSERPAAC